LDVNLIPSYGTPPSERYWISMTYSPSYNVIVVFGGTDDTNYFNDVWIFDLSTTSWMILYPASSAVPGNY
jgi:Galactose oxidase, central domain